MLRPGGRTRGRLYVPVLPPAMQEQQTYALSHKNIVSETHPDYASSVDLQLLRTEIDTLSEQLVEVRAQLESQPRSQDSRMSTVICSPISESDHPRTPSPSRVVFEDFRPATLPRKESLQKKIVNIHTLGRIPPQKPQRTFTETSFSNVSSIGNEKGKSSSTRWSTMLAVCDEDAYDEYLLADFLIKSFNDSVCWFEMTRCLLFVNPFNDIHCQRSFRYMAMSRLASKILQQPEYVVLYTGDSGGGKSYLAEQLVLNICDRTARPRGVMSSTVNASITLLHALTSVHEEDNHRASKMVHWWEVNVRDGRLQRVKLRHFLGDTVNKQCSAIVFATIATQMGSAEKERFRIGGFTLGVPSAQSSHVRLSDIRSALTVLCIPFDDLLRVLSACILLNNLLFYETDDGVDVENITDMEDAAFLLGLSALSLFKRLTSRSILFHKETVTGLKTVSLARLERDFLVSALYTRCLQSIVKRTNAVLELAGCEGSEDGSLDDSGIGSNECSSTQIDVIDLPGLRTSNNNSVYEMCLNIASEKTRHFFMRTTLADDDAQYEDCLFVDLLKPKKGFLNVLDHVCEQPMGCLKMLERNTEELKLSQVKIQHSSFVVRHFDGRVMITYNLVKLVERNRNHLRKDMAQLFEQSRCSFKYAVSLFASDIEANAQRDQFVPKVVKCPTVESEHTFSRQFLNKVDTVLKRAAQHNLQIVHCLKSNAHSEFSKVNPGLLHQQLVNWRLYEMTRPIVEESYHSDTEKTDNPPIPPERNYIIKDNQKYFFPQRRKIVVDYQDMSSGIYFKANDIVKAISFFFSDSYVVENENGETASIPCRFTEKSGPVGIAEFNV